jgi:hypothetical protein
MGAGGKKHKDRSTSSPAALVAILQSQRIDRHTTHYLSHSYGPRIQVSRKTEDAPSLYPGADRFRWRRQVAAWVSYIQRRADAGDKTCKSHAATLYDLLYAAAHPSYQKVLELAKSASLDFSVPTEKQPAVVQEIVRLIEYESPIEATSRLLAA